MSIDQCSDLDSILVLLNDCISIEETGNWFSAKLVPNPFSLTVEIQTDPFANDSINFPISGKEVLRSENLIIVISNFSNGQYIVELKTESDSYHLRLVKDNV